MKAIKRRVPKYAMGIEQVNQLNNSAQGLGNYIDSYGTNNDGTQTDLSAVGSGALQGAGMGASVGMMVGGPIGAGIGAGAGALIGGTAKYFGNKRKNKEIEAANAEEATQEAEMKAEMGRQRAELEGQQQLNYSRSYYAANPSGGQLGASIYAYGTKKLPNTNMYASGGNFVPVSSNVAKINGASHANGGVDLQANGKAIAEVEGGETIINNQSIASRRIILPNGKTVAEETEMIGKQIGKNEKKLSSLNPATKNTGKRTIANLNNNLQQVLDYQEQFKATNNIETGKMAAYGGRLPKYWKGGDLDEDPNNYDTTQSYFDQALQKVPLEERLKFRPSKELLDDGDLTLPQNTTDIDYLQKITSNSQEPQLKGGFKSSNPDETFEKLKTVTGEETIPTSKSYDYLNAGINGVNAVAPYLDNMANLKAIKNAPRVPAPNMLKTKLASAMPMKTTYNINPALISANDDYKTFQKNVDDNTSNSAISRGNKLAAYSKNLANKGELYAKKENVETQLINQDSANRQAVNSMNVQNAQNVENTNYAKLDKYNEQKTARLDDNRRELSKNVANLSSDLKTGLYDQDRKRVYTSQMLTDALQYRDGASVAQMIDTNYMDDYVADINNYKQIEQVLKNQPEALEKFYKKYGKK